MYRTNQKKLLSFRTKFSFLLSVILLQFGVLSAQNSWFEGFEDVNWTTSGQERSEILDGPQAGIDDGWNIYVYDPDISSVSMNRVSNGTLGYNARTGNAFAHISEGDHPWSNNGSTQSKMGGYQSTFANHTTSIDLYVDLTDANMSGAAGDYRVDVTSAINNASGQHRRDFIFNMANDADGNLRVKASNNSGDGNVTFNTGFATLDQSGWYTFEWQFRDRDGVLGVGMNIYNNAGDRIYGSTRSNPADTIDGSTIGGHRYLWFSKMDTANGLGVDNSSTAPVETADFGGGQVTLSNTHTAGNRVTTVEDNQTATEVIVENTAGGKTTLEILPSGFLTGGIVVNEGGKLTGGGKITGDVNVGDDGSHSPGFSPGVQSISGDYNNSGTLEIELGGTVELSGSLNSITSGNYDQLIIQQGDASGDVDLSGNLVLFDYDGFIPEEGDIFTIVMAEGVIDITGLTLDTSTYDGNGLAFQLTTGSTTFDSTNFNTLELTVVDETSTFAVLLGTMAMAYTLRIRNRRLRK